MFAGLNFGLGGGLPASNWLVALLFFANSSLNILPKYVC